MSGIRSKPRYDPGPQQRLVIGIFAATPLILVSSLKFRKDYWTPPTSG